MKDPPKKAENILTLEGGTKFSAEINKNNKNKMSSSGQRSSDEVFSPKKKHTQKTKPERRILQFSSPLAVPYVKKLLAPSLSEIQCEYHPANKTIELSGHNLSVVVDCMKDHLCKIKAMITQAPQENRAMLEEFYEFFLKEECFLELYPNPSNRNSIWIAFAGNEERFTLFNNYLKRVLDVKVISDLSMCFKEENNVQEDENSDSDDTVSISSISVASEFNNLSTGAKDDLHRKKIRLIVSVHWDSDLQKELDNLLEKWPTVHYSIQNPKKQSVAERHIEIASPMKRDVEEYHKAALQLLPNKSLKLSAKRLKLVKESKSIQNNVNKLKVTMVFNKQGLGFYGIGSKETVDEAVELVNKFLDEKDVKIEQFKFCGENKSRIAFINAFIVPKLMAFKGVNIKHEDAAFTISGKGTDVEQVFTELKKLRKQIIRKQLEYDVTDTNASYFARNQLKKKLEEIAKRADTELIFNVKLYDSSKVVVTVTCMDAKLLAEIDTMVQSVCREVTSDVIHFTRRDLETVNQLNEQNFNKEWDVEISKQYMRICIRGLSQESVRKAKEAFMTLLRSTSSDTIIKVPCRLFIRILMKKEDVEQIAAKYKAKLFADKLRVREVDCLSFKVNENHVQDITRDIEKLMLDIEQSLCSEQVVLSKMEYSVLKTAKAQLNRMMDETEVEIVWARNNQVSKLSTKFKGVSSSQEYCWYYINDDNELKSYTAACNKIISKAFNEGRKQFQLSIGTKTYEIDFDREIQKNTETNFERKLQKKLPTKYCWSWIDDGKVEQYYSLENAAKIEKGYQLKEQYIVVNLSRMLDDRRQDYYIFYDYQNGNHIQQNCATKFQRQMRRKEEQYTPCTALEKNISRSPQRDERVFTIELLGRLSNIPKAKHFLVELFKKLVAFRKLNMTRVSLTLLEVRELIKDIRDIEVIETKDGDGSKCFTLKGLKEKLDAAENIILRAESQQPTSMKYPKHWIAQTENCKLINLDSSCQEYIRVSAKVKHTLPQCRIIKVERIQNQWLWKKYVNQRELIEMKNGGDSNEQYLFHGTKSTPPKQVYEDEVGFDMRHSQQGMWGRGCYFANNASYSGGYAHTLASTNEKQMFLAKVAVGDAIQMNNDAKITMPPVKNTGVDIAHSIRYDAINSPDGNIFIIYENSRAYPEYLITFQ